MKVRWTRDGYADLERVVAFLASRSRAARVSAVEDLTDAPSHLVVHPRLGVRLEDFDPREVRRLIVGEYELRYEIAHDTIVVLRIFHGLENR